MEDVMIAFLIMLCSDQRAGKKHSDGRGLNEDPVQIQHTSLLQKCSYFTAAGLGNTRQRG